MAPTSKAEKVTQAPHADGASLSEEVASVLQRQILSGELAVDTWIRHAALADELGVSRTPVREALRILAARGLVKIEQNRGARVVGQSTGDIREIGAVRAELEGFAADLASQHILDDQVVRLQDAWTDFRASLKDSQEEQARQWAKANEDFHSIILEAADNRYLSMMIDELRRRLPHNLSFGAYAGNSRLIERNLREHEAIAAAIIAQKPTTARRLMSRHIRDSHEAIVRWVERQPGRE